MGSSVWNGDDSWASEVVVGKRLPSDVAEEKAKAAKVKGAKPVGWELVEDHLSSNTKSNRADIIRSFADGLSTAEVAELHSISERVASTIQYSNPERIAKSNQNYITVIDRILGVSFEKLEQALYDDKVKAASLPIIIGVLMDKRSSLMTVADKHVTPRPEMNHAEIARAYLSGLSAAKKAKASIIESPLTEYVTSPI